MGGIVFGPGRAGTVQEIFQDLCQNHYGTSGAVSPMVFLGSAFWTQELPVFPVVSALMGARSSMLLVCDRWEDALHFLQTHPPCPFPAPTGAASILDGSEPNTSSTPAPPESASVGQASSKEAETGDDEHASKRSKKE
jgi:hypothetical protein